MNITLVSTSKILETKGGVEKMFCEMANHFARQGHSVTAICLSDKNCLPVFPIDKSINFINCGLFPLTLYQSKFFIKLRALSLSSQKRKENRWLLQYENQRYRLCQALKRASHDVIISFEPFTTFLIKDFQKKAPVITMIHSIPSILLSPETPQPIKQAVEASSYVQVLRPEFKLDLLEILPKAKVLVIPNPVTQTLDICDCDKEKIINVARISRGKRQALIIEAFALIKDEFPDWQVVFYGDTNFDPIYTNHCQTLIDGMGLQKRVFLCGTTSDVNSKLKDSAIFAFPSMYEGMPLSLTEAMALGLPSIGCQECPSVNTLIQDGENGFLCEASAAALADAMKKLISDSKLRKQMGRRAKLDMEAYAPEKVWDCWMTCFQKIT